VTAVVEIEGLSKTYRSVRRGQRKALDSMDMVVESGQVHGFLGPNGSGKTTTLRTLLGLVRADDGRMRLLGREVPAALPEVVDEVGAIVESPQFFGNFSARRTLDLLATAGGLRKTRIDEVLELVGLRDRAKERVKTYSLGMKQRLAVASALLKEPRLLILDEPANGLDPAGIREMRDMMRALAAGGTTVLLSSHILGEVQLICDSVTIVSRGRRVTAGPVGRVLAAHDTGTLRVRVADHAAAAAVLDEAGVAAQLNPDHLVLTGVADPAAVTRLLAERGHYLSELTPLRPDLESVFLELTGTTPHAGVARQVDDSVQVAP